MNRSGVHVAINAQFDSTRDLDRFHQSARRPRRAIHRHEHPFRPRPILSAAPAVARREPVAQLKTDYDSLPERSHRRCGLRPRCCSWLNTRFALQTQFAEGLIRPVDVLGHERNEFTLRRADRPEPFQKRPACRHILHSEPRPAILPDHTAPLPEPHARPLLAARHRPRQPVPPGPIPPLPLTHL